jgi:hypothetical protein
MGAAAVVGNAKNCGLPAKTKARWASGAKETAADIGRPAKDQCGGMCAANCGKLVSTRTSWENAVKVIAAVTGKRVKVASKYF